MFRKVLLLVTMLSGIISNAQDRNEVYTLKFNDLTYTAPDGKATAGEVIGTVLETLIGSATNKSHPELAPGISNMIKSALSDVLRLTLVNDDAMYEISGNIDKIYTNTTVDRDGSTCTAEINATLTLTDVATGEQWTQSFSSGNGWWLSEETESKAEQQAIKNMCKAVVSYYNNMFPLEGSIIERGKVKKDKLQEVYIDLGDFSGIRKGQKFNVYSIEDVGGTESRKKLGELKLEEVVGKDASRCKVQEGQKELKAALDNGMTLLVESKH